MAYRGYLELGGTELANTRRVVQYMRTAECSNTLEVRNDDSWPDVHRWLQHEPYVDPITDAAPWVAEDRPVTGEFLGVWLLAMDGMDSAPLRREPIEAAGAGGGFTALRWGVREVQVTAVLVGATPVGLEYGIEWLNAALVQDQCQPMGSGRSLRFLAAAPYVGWDATDQEVRAAGVEQERWLHNVVATQPVTVAERFGRWDKDGSQAIAARVEFTLSAANPFVWKAPRSLVPPTTLAAGDLRSVTFERVNPDGTWPSMCVDENPPLTDPLRPATRLLPRPVTPASEVGYQQFTARHTELVVPGEVVRPWETMVPTLTIIAGPQDERSVRVQWVRGSNLDDLACASIGEAMIGYIPAGATFTLDGVTGLATVRRAGASVDVDATAVVTGRNGAPWRAPVLRCGDEHTLVVQAASTVHAATVVAAHGNVRMN